MSEAVENYAKRYAEQVVENVRLNTLLGSIKNLMDSMKWPVEQAMDMLEVSDSDKEILLKRL